MMVVGEDVG